MKLITWNVQWTLGIDKGYGAERVVKAAREMADFDVLCLQEVADNWPELRGSSGEDQYALFADLLPGFTAIEGPALDVAAEDGRRKRFGNMILSRLPVGLVQRHPLSWGGADACSMPRLCLEAVVETRFGPVRVNTLHLEYSTPVLRNAQIESLREIHRLGSARAKMPPKVQPHGNPTYGPFAQTASALFCGDFNMNPDDGGKAWLQQPFTDGISLPLVDLWQAAHGDEPHPHSFCIYDQSFLPAHCCDFVFATPDLAQRLTRISYNINTKVSDHQPVLVEFRS